MWLSKQNIQQTLALADSASCLQSLKTARVSSIHANTHTRLTGQSEAAISNECTAAYDHRFKSQVQPFITSLTEFTAEIMGTNNSWCLTSAKNMKTRGNADECTLNGWSQSSTSRWHVDLISALHGCFSKVIEAKWRDDSAELTEKRL